MNISPVVCATLALASLASCASRDTAPGQPEPPPAVEHQTELHMKFRIEWREREPFPWTYNGGTVGRVEQYVVYATGFGRRVPDQLKRKPGYFNGYHRLLAVYHVPSRVWTQAEPLFPGTARAYGTYSVSDGKHAYVLGGQSYAPGYCFKDAWRLSRENGEWRWQQLPDMLTETAEFGSVLIDGSLYVQGGDHYFMEGPHKGWDSEHEGAGRHFETLDLSHTEDGWKRLPDMPGACRSHHAVAAVGRRVYVFGGVFSRGGDDPKYWNVVDNWRYDTDEGKWTRIRDLPFPCGGWSSLTYRDRYVLLFGGFYGREVRDVDGASRPPYGCKEAAFSNRVIVYDAQTNEFAEATPMPVAINDTRLVWLDERTMMNVTGEIPGSRRIPCVLVGRACW